jgi:glycosyltransferase involved in cell wall biosynthesis
MLVGRSRIGGITSVTRNLSLALQKQGVQIRIGMLRTPFTSKFAYVDKTNVIFQSLRDVRIAVSESELVHSHHPLSNWFSIGNSKPFVYHFHGAPVASPLSPTRLSLAVSLRMLASRFSRIIAVTEYSRQELLKYGVKNAVTIYNGVSLDIFRTGLEPKFRTGNPQLLFVGNLYKHKNVPELLLGLKKLTKRFPHASLSVVGQGPELNPQKRLARDLGIAGNVVFWGKVSEESLPHHYASCNIYVTASRWEHFGLPLLESMACGKGIVASAIPAHSELLGRSKAGLTYPLGNSGVLADRVAEALENPGLGENGVRFSQNQSWDLVAQRVIAVYRNVLGE